MNEILKKIDEAITYHSERVEFHKQANGTCPMFYLHKGRFFEARAIKGMLLEQQKAEDEKFQKIFVELDEYKNEIYSEEKTPTYEQLKYSHDLQCGIINTLEKLNQDLSDRVMKVEGLMSESKIIQAERKEPCEEYINWLENMIILLSRCYQQTHDMLLKKMKEGNKTYLEMPTVQGFEMCMMVDKIGKLKPSGTITGEKLEGFTNWLTEKFNQPAESEE